MDIRLNLVLLLLVMVRNVPLAEPRFPLAVLQKEKADLGQSRERNLSERTSEAGGSRSRSSQPPSPLPHHLVARESDLPSQRVLGFIGVLVDCLGV
jgi:hypothetical protein